jgi:hypothetical protein
MKGVALTKKEGAIKDSVIKLNYIFTIPGEAVERVFFKLTKEKKREVHKALRERIKALEG